MTAPKGSRKIQVLLTLETEADFDLLRNAWFWREMWDVYAPFEPDGTLINTKVSKVKVSRPAKEA